MNGRNCQLYVQQYTPFREQHFWRNVNIPVHSRLGHRQVHNDDCHRTVEHRRELCHVARHLEVSSPPRTEDSHSRVQLDSNRSRILPHVDLLRIRSVEGLCLLQRSLQVPRPSCRVTDPLQDICNSREVDPHLDHRRPIHRDTTPTRVRNQVHESKREASHRGLLDDGTRGRFGDIHSFDWVRFLFMSTSVFADYDGRVRQWGLRCCGQRDDCRLRENYKGSDSPKIDHIRSSTSIERNEFQKNETWTEGGSRACCCSRNLHSSLVALPSRKVLAGDWRHCKVHTDHRRRGNGAWVDQLRARLVDLWSREQELQESRQECVIPPQTRRNNSNHGRTRNTHSNCWKWVEFFLRIICVESWNILSILKTNTIIDDNLFYIFHTIR